MVSRAHGLALLLATTAFVSAAHAYPEKLPDFDPSSVGTPYSQPAPWPDRFSPISPIQRTTIETGMRYWFSSGRYKFDLYDTSGAMNVSRLTYDGSVAQSAEGYFRLDYNRFFTKGNLGGGSFTGGHMNDQDFAPLTVPESNTRQEMKDSSLRYGAIDLGYSLIDTGWLGMGAFIGYGYWAERMNSFGCAQVGGGDFCSPVAVGTNVNSLNGESVWNMLRAGVAGSWEFYPGLKWSADAAYVRGWQSGHDFHVLRPDIDGVGLEATGNGLSADGDVRFDQTISASSGFVSQPIKIEQDRYGVFVQAGYKFGDRAAGAAVPYANLNGSGASWTGFYAGPIIGYGSSLSSNRSTSFVPTTSSASALASVGAVPPTVSVDNAGVTAGVAIGYNWQLGRELVGAEGDISYAHIAGANGRTDPLTGVTTTVDQSLGWFGTLRGRVGHLLTQDLLVFGTAGAAFGDTKLDVSSQQVSTSVPCQATGYCASGSTAKVRMGWTAGAGIEYRVNSWASVKAEALYYDLGILGSSMTDTSAGAPANFDANARFNAGLLRSGINFHW